MDLNTLRDYAKEMNWTGNVEVAQDVITHVQEAYPGINSAAAIALIFAVSETIRTNFDIKY